MPNVDVPELPYVVRSPLVTLLVTGISWSIYLGTTLGLALAALHVPDRVLFTAVAITVSGVLVRATSIEVRVTVHGIRTRNLFRTATATWDEIDNIGGGAEVAFLGRPIAGARSTCG